MTDFLLPVDDDELTAPFWAGCARGELLMQRFTASGRWCWPPRPMDPETRTLEYEWVPVSGKGTVWSVTIPYPPLLPAYSELAPYNVVLVELDEHPATQAATKEAVAIRVPRARRKRFMRLD